MHYRDIGRVPSPGNLSFTNASLEPNLSTVASAQKKAEQVGPRTQPRSHTAHPRFSLPFQPPLTDAFNEGTRTSKAPMPQLVAEVYLLA